HGLPEQQPERTAAERQRRAHRRPERDLEQVAPREIRRAGTTRHGSPHSGRGGSTKSNEPLRTLPKTSSGRLKKAPWNPAQKRRPPSNGAVTTPSSPCPTPHPTF